MLCISVDSADIPINACVLVCVMNGGKNYCTIDIRSNVGLSVMLARHFD
jgi:hypothetical protein